LTVPQRPAFLVTWRACWKIFDVLQFEIPAIRKKCVARSV
jgi:hypothetical protein